MNIVGIRRLSIMTNKQPNIRFVPDLLSGVVYDIPTLVGLPIGEAALRVVTSSQYSPSILNQCNIIVNGETITGERLKERIKSDDVIAIVMPISGGGGSGKNPLATILMAVVVIAATVVTYGAAGYASATAWGGVAAAGPMAAGAGLTVAGVSGLSIAGAAFAIGAGLAVSIAGMALINSVFKPSTTKLTAAEQAAETWAISGTRNSFSPYSRIPLVLGKIRYAPHLLATPYTYLEGNNQHVRYLYGVMGHNKVTNLRIGWTAIENFPDITYRIYENWDGRNFKFFSNAFYEESVALSIKQSTGSVVRTTADNTKETYLQFTYPQGLIRYDKKQRSYAVSIQYEIKIFKAGSSTYEKVINVTHSGQTPTLQRRGLTITHDTPGRFDISVRRITGDADPGNITEPTFSAGEWTTIRSVKLEKPINYSRLNGCPLTIIEVDARASERLSGDIDELNALFESYVPVYNKDDDEWVNEPSSNIAGIALMLATTPVIDGETMSMDDFNLSDFAAFQDWNDKYGWHYCAVITSATTCGQLWDDVLSGGRAIKTMRNGKITVAWDDPDKLSVTTFGPRNSSGFVIKRTYQKQEIHGLRYKFINEAADYQEDERVVYADGYNADNATYIVDSEQDGCVRSDIIWKHGRLRLAEIIHRNISCEFDVDFSFMAIQQFERFSANQPVGMWGITQARAIGLVINEITKLVTHIEIDDYVTVAPNKMYGAIWQADHGLSVHYAVESSVTESTRFLKLVTPISEDKAPSFDALINFGESGKESKDLVAVGILPSGGTTAKIIAHAHAPEIYQALEGDIPPFESSVTIPSRWLVNAPNQPVIRSIITDERALLLQGTTVIPRIIINYNIENKPGVSISRVVALSRLVGQNEWMYTSTQTLEALENNFVIISGVLELENYELRIYAVSNDGTGSPLTPIFTTQVIGRTTPPPAPLSVHIDGSRIWWVAPDDMPIDFIGWEVLMGMDAGDPVEYAKVLTNPLTNSQEFDISNWSGWARRVFVRAVDDLGLRSEAISVVINFGDVPVENVIYEILESDRGWPGTITGAEFIDGVFYATGLTPMWSKRPRWNRVPMWGGSYNKIIYETQIIVPEEADQSMLSVNPIMQSGRVISIELSSAETFTMWDENTMWGERSMWGSGLDSGFFQMPNNVYVRSGQVFNLIIVCATDTQAGLRDIIWGFDVEDAPVISIDDLSVPATGIRLPVPKRHFRWIKSIAFGLEFTAGGTATQVGFLDRGILSDGHVVEGPMVECIDASGNRVAGVIDATLQGAKGLII